MEIAGLDLWVALACIGVVTVGSTLQGTIGLGMGLLAAPLLALALLVLPGVPMGLVLSKPLIGRLPEHRVRPLVLVVCAASALALLVDELV